MFLTVLVAVFVVETMEMFVLPSLLRGASAIAKALADALLLVALIAPCVWWVVVRPLRSAAVAQYALAQNILAQATDAIVTIDEHGIARDITGRKRTEDALRDSEARLRLLVERMPAVLWTTDTNLRFTSSAGAGLAALGLRPNQVVGMTLYEYFQTSDPEMPPIAAHLRALRGESATYEFEWTGNAYSSHVLPLRDAAGRVTGCIGIALDVTEQKRTTEALRASEASLRAFSDNAAFGFYRSTLDGRLTMVNQTLVNMLGYDSAEELLGADLATQVYQDPQERDRVLRSYGHQDRIDGVEVKLKQKDGSRITVLLYGVAVRDKQEQVVAFEGIAQDVTERRRAEKRLRLQGAALQAAANAILITDREGVIQWVNPAFTAVTGYAFEEAIGHTPRLIKSGTTDPSTYEELWRTIRAGQVWHGELLNRRKDGTLYRQDLTITPVRDERGEITHFVGVCQDVTERRQLEEQFRQAQKMEAVGQLTGGIAHDFNNLLSVIIGNAEIIAESLGREHAGLKGEVQDIETAASRGAAMIKKLLGFSRQAELQMLPLNIAQVVDGLSGMLRRLLPEDIEIRLDLDKPVGTVRADAGALEQILVNLATNARDAMPDGGTLRIGVEENVLGDEDCVSRPWLEPGEYVCLDVTDTGVGMDEETKARIFEPFFTTKPPGKGTGLGMAMIYGLAKQHGGFVHVYSELGKGTAVRLYLPVVREQAAVAVAARRPVAEVRGGDETILLAEDEEALRRTCKRVLERLGYTVLAAADGEEALALYRAHHQQIDLVISDIVMPKLGGRELYEAIQQEGKGVKFLFASGYAAGELQARAGISPSIPQLPKPWTLSEIARMVRATLDQELGG